MVVDFSNAGGHGAGDRLRRLTYFLAVARLSGDDTIAMKENISPSCPFNLSDMLLVDGMRMMPWTESFGDERWTLTPVCPYPELKAARRSARPGLDVSAQRFVKEWEASYRTLRPVSSIAATVDAIAVDKSCLGVHIRRTDKVRVNPGKYFVAPEELSRGDAQLVAFITAKCAKYGIRKAYLATDNAAARFEWMDRLTRMGLEVVAHEPVFREDQLRHTSGEDFFVDLFALSRCRALVRSVHSSVCSSAAFMGNIRDLSTAFTDNDRGVTGAVRRISARLRAITSFTSPA